MFGAEYRSLSSLLCSFLHSHVTLSILGPNILLSTLFSHTLCLCSLPQCERPSFTPIQNHRQNYRSISSSSSFSDDVKINREITYPNNSW
jgi:hypothetical protein